MSRLHAEQWLAPEHPGPSSSFSWRLQGVTALLLVLWALFPAGNLRAAREGDVRVHVITVNDDGTARVGRRSLDTEVRIHGGTEFLVVSEQLDLDDAPVDLRVDAPPSVNAADVAVRRILPHGGRAGRDGEVLVTIPLDELPGAKRVDHPAQLDALTEPFDAHAREVHDDLRLQQRLRTGWWWILPLVFLLGTWLPLWLWRRSAGRFFSMRLPGPGKEFGVEPPSALDPVGAAVLRAGVGPIDYVSAFLGATFDLVERRQVQMRRTTDEAAGAAGALIVLGPPDETVGSDDPVVDVLRTAAEPDGVTIAIPDLPDELRQVPRSSWAYWREHVDARARFERLVDEVDTTRLRIVSAACAVLAALAAVGSMIVVHDGKHAAGLVVLLLTMPPAITCWRWHLDASTWRVVTKRRRTERAQWLAWRRVVGQPGGPELHGAQMPVVMATGLVAGIIHDTAGELAVGLDAVTGSTLRTLRGMLPGDGR